MKLWFYIIRLCFLLSSSCLFWTVNAQQAGIRYGISPTTRLQDCALNQWTGDNGLLSNNLTSVIQAHSGFLWITTNNGLMRFDGSRLEIFDQGVIPFLSTDAFYRVYEDEDSVLWFATRGNGIVKYEHNKFEPYLPKNRLIPKSLRSLLIMKDGSMYAGSDTKGLHFIDDTLVVKINDPLLQNASILSLDSAGDGSILIGTNNNGLLRLREGKIEQIRIDNRLDHYVNTIKSLPNGQIFVGTTEGLFCLNNGDTKKYDFLQNIQINQITADQFGSIWVASERGLARINEKYNLHEFLRAGKNFPGSHITGVFPDKEGSIWMSTGKSGLLRLKESQIRNYSEDDGLSVNRVNTITEGSDGKFYVCLDDGYVNVIDHGLISNFPIQNKLWTESIRDIYVEKNGTVWIASYNGVMKKNKYSEKVFTTSNGLSSNSVRRILADSTGNLWFGTRTGGVIQMKDDKVLKIYNMSSGLASNYVLALEQDGEGRLLIGTHSGGLNIINKDGSTEVYHVKADDEGVLIFNIDIDQSNRIFLATSIGLYYFDPREKTFTKIVLTDVAKGESYFDWVEDRNGGIWVTTNIGILHMRKKDVINFLAGEIKSVKTKLYNDFDGMKNKECTGATRSTLSSKGEIWVPTIEGICIINPNNIKLNKIVPAVYITELATDKKAVQNPVNHVVVEPGNFRISINFTTTSLLAPSKVNFKYRLANIDNEWRTADPFRRSVDYTNLQPGSYSFFVKASNNDGVWNDEGVRLEILVKPFYYQTAWFYLIILFVLLVSFFGLYKWRVSAIEQKNAELLKVNMELDRFVYSASHDLRAPLTSILGLVKLTRIDTDAQNRLQYLDMVEKSIHKLDGFIHDIINYSRNARTELKPDDVNFDALVTGIFDALSFQDKSQKIRKEVQVKGQGSFFTDAKRLEIVLFNLISNAIKYHNTFQEDPYIKVKVFYTKQNCTIEVIDNGSGIDKEHLNNIFKMFYRADDKSTGSGLGLFIAKETVEKLSGVLSVKSAVAKGSTFRIQIPGIVTNLA